MRKKIKSNVYYNAKFGSGIFNLKVRDSEILYEDGQRKSRLTEKDLPDTFIKIYVPHWGMYRYVNTEAVRYVYARASFLNHYRKDDCIYISYDKPIEVKEDRYSTDVLNYDVAVYGVMLNRALEMIERFSPECDLSQARRCFRKKDRWLRKTHPELLPDDYVIK